MTRLFVANWKMHGSMDFVRTWAQALRPPAVHRLAVCPPLPYLAAARAALPDGVQLGAQTLAAAAEDGAHTGEVSARMLADVGCTLCIVGHSERRQAQHEDDALCAAKVRAAADAGLQPLLCVGESAAQRQRGSKAAQDAVLGQLTGALAGAAESIWQRLIIAYEPVWAIGSGKTPSAEDIDAMHAALRRWLIEQTAAFGDTITLLYGGSVSAANARELIGIHHVNGFLVGGASLKPDAFNAICTSPASPL